MLGCERNNAGVSPICGRDRSRGVVIRRHPTRCRILRDMCVRLDTARHNQMAACIDYIRTLQILAQGCNFATRYADVRDKLFGRGDACTVFYDSVEGHVSAASLTSKRMVRRVSSALSRSVSAGPGARTFGLSSTPRRCSTSLRIARPRPNCCS